MKRETQELVKVAYCTGKARGLIDQGYPVESVKLAFMDEGWGPEEADFLVKEAIWGAIGRGLMAGAKHIPKLLSKVPGGASKLKGMSGPLTKNMSQFSGKFQSQLGATAGLIKKPVASGGLAQRAGGMLHRAGGAASKAMEGMATAPGKTLWGGTKEFGKGLMFMPSKGIGGTLGKGTAAYQIGSSLFGGGGQQQPQPQQRPPYGQHY